MNRRPLRPGLPGVFAATSAIVLPGLVAIGCLDRPIDVVDPRITSTIVEVVPHSGVDKIDLVLGIDNSASMADKQQMLAQAIPDLVESLVNPPCINEAGAPLPSAEQPKGPSEDCPTGSRREFEPVLDIHIGIVSSSLGGHGGGHCPDLQTDPSCSDEKVSKNDRGHLLSRADPCVASEVVPTYANKGFLAWDPKEQLSPPGETNLGTLDGSEPGLVPALADMVRGTGQVGCGYESQLESIYRFLVDPEPYGTIDASSGNVKVSDTDDVLLKQRKDFLRPDSLVAILMLSDENDCSIKESGFNFRASHTAALPRPRAECAIDPNDKCCTSCGMTPPAGCPEDPGCFDAQGNVMVLTQSEDPVDLRCFDQKRRFGVNFLYPTDRYVKAFSSPEITTRSGELVENPLFPKANPAGGVPVVRTPDLVFLAGIVGVPWQDIARDPADLTKGIKNAREMGEDGTWDVIVGDPAKGILPTDPLMHESPDPRAGKHPITGEQTDMDPSSPLGNSINGHEYDTLGEDLQYACIFELPEATDCPNDPKCAECRDGTAANPLCDPATPTMRVRAKAYPGLRQLDVLRGLGDQGIVGSVCPKQVNDRTKDDYGYRPAIGALVDRLKAKIGGPCLPRTLDRDKEGAVNCLLIEARPTGGACSCDSEHARLPVDDTHAAAIDEAKARSPEAGWDCFCQIPQLKDEELTICQNDVSDDPVTPAGEPVSGFCYVDASTDPAIGNPALVARCADSERRMIRLVGEGEPSKGATLFVTCSGDSSP
ncbi:hypothetical protein [Polyangium jinanense]|uniref:Uncharacterized protein n=1 Tax=Polyangium jinanense TaxID=2829994 RepID=A0A9X3X870_9BACT|nr:hypothetical protein [Polyangium jinanense]MDC3959104.1 hypothetical protein [Polyangium jinanense]MDC3983973.1 hypothetical protein [Polyangium jinanense]